MPYNNQFTQTSEKVFLDGLKKAGVVEKPSQEITTQHLENLRAKYIDHCFKGEYDKAVLDLMQHRDERNGIAWRWIKPSTDQQHRKLNTLVRDARLRGGRKATQSFENYALLQIQYVRGALALLKAEGGNDAQLENARLVFNPMLVKAMEEMRNAETEAQRQAIFQGANVAIAQCYAECVGNFCKESISRDEALERIGFAKDVVNLENPSFHVVTLSNVVVGGNARTVLEGDIAYHTLTKEQAKRYDGQWQVQGWFQGLGDGPGAKPNWKQKVVLAYQDKFNEGGRVIPTQLRFMPGIRNSYCKVTQVVPENQNEPAPVHSVFHTGTVVALPESKVAQFDPILEYELTCENADQLRIATTSNNLSGEPNYFQFVTLNSAKLGFTGDEKMVKETAVAIGYQERSQNFHSNACINEFRAIEKNKYPGIEKQFELLNCYVNDNKGEWSKSDRGMDDLFKDVQEYLQKGGKSKGLQNRLLENKGQLNQKKPGLFHMLEAAVLCREAMDKSRLGRESFTENHSLQATVLSNLLAMHMRDVAKINFSNAVACKSGKDRTGLVLYATAVAYVTQQLFGTLQVTEKQLGEVMAMMETLASGGHMQYMAGLAGGMGSIGIVSKEPIPNSYGPAVKDLLALSTASMNKEPPAGDVVWGFKKTKAHMVKEKKGVPEEFQAFVEVVRESAVGKDSTERSLSGAPSRRDVIPSDSTKPPGLLEPARSPSVPSVPPPTLPSAAPPLAVPDKPPPPVVSREPEPPSQPPPRPPRSVPQQASDPRYLNAQSSKRSAVKLTLPPPIRPPRPPRDAPKPPAGSSSLTTVASSAVDSSESSSQKLPSSSSPTPGKSG